MGGDDVGGDVGGGGGGASPYARPPPARDPASSALVEALQRDAVGGLQRAHAAADGTARGQDHDVARLAGRDPGVPGDAIDDDVFNEADDLWSVVLARKGGPYALLSRMPPDPSLN